MVGTPTPLAKTLAEQSEIALKDEFGPSSEFLQGLMGRERPIAEGEFICLEGARAESVFEVVAGLIKFYKISVDGYRQIIGFAGPGDWLGLGARGRYTYSAEAVVPTVVRAYRRGLLERQAHKNGTVAEFLLRIASETCARTEDHLLMLGRRRAIEKLAAFLNMAKSWQTGRTHDADCVIELPLDRMDIADFLGLSIETVSRKFSELKQLKIIELESPTRVVVLDWSRVTALADGHGRAVH